jgi:putative ABC transport system permease protein
MNTANINLIHLTLGYLMLLIPMGIMLWLKIELLGKTALAALRMTVQLLFVGFYLQVVFEADNFWLTLAWLIIMVTVADFTIIRGCRLRMRRFLGSLFIALLAGTAVPLIYFVGIILTEKNLLAPQFAIPIGGMILGNCLRADVIGIAGFYESIKDNRRSFLLSLSQGASLAEAMLPHFRKAFSKALMPTISTMSTIGLVSLPGMMTGVILAGADPITAIKYQIAIMISIFTGTSITIVLGILLTTKNCFTGYGLPVDDIFIT